MYQPTAGALSENRSLGTAAVPGARRRLDTHGDIIMEIKKRFTFANVVSVAALIMATAGAGGGVAYAHGKIGSADIKKNAVKSKHVKNNNLKSSDIRNNNLRGKDIRDGSLGVQDLSTGVLSGISEAWVNVSFNGTVNRAYNRKGGAPTVVHTNLGQYTITVPGTSATDGSAVVSVNGGSISGESCIMEDVNADGSFDIDCFDTDTGALSDENFQFVLFQS
jgi:hypothetical protein